jgi:flagellar biosynthetic protein FlhB
VSETGVGERSFEATDRRLEQARERGDVPSVREAPVAGVYIGALIGLVLLGGTIARRVGEIVLPMLEQPDALLDLTPDGWRDAGRAVAMALALAIVPFFVLTMAGALLPYVMHNAIAISPDRIMPKLSNLSPSRGFKRMFSTRALFEFGTSLAKMAVIAGATYFLMRPIYRGSVGLVATDLALLPGMLLHSVFLIVGAATLVAVAVAAVDAPYQHWAYRRRLRMTLQEMKDEVRESEGDPRVKARRRMLRRKRAHRRMMHEVPKATVIIANPTHFAVALRYRRGEDAAPVVVAKGVELIALRIRKVAREHGIAIVENPPLARALHAAVEIGDVIPREHFETVAKIIGLVWAQRRVVPVG